eukprot:s485_g5.t1
MRIAHISPPGLSCRWPSQQERERPWLWHSTILRRTAYAATSLSDAGGSEVDDQRQELEALRVRLAAAEGREAELRTQLEGTGREAEHATQSKTEALQQELDAAISREGEIRSKFHAAEKELHDLAQRARGAEEGHEKQLARVREESRSATSVDAFWHQGELAASAARKCSQVLCTVSFCNALQLASSSSRCRS